jgi:hypothetical protein
MKELGEIRDSMKMITNFVGLVNPAVMSIKNDIQGAKDQIVQHIDQGFCNFIHSQKGSKVEYSSHDFRDTINESSIDFQSLKYNLPDEKDNSLNLRSLREEFKELDLAHVKRGNPYLSCIRPPQREDIETISM